MKHTALCLFAAVVAVQAARLTGMLAACWYCEHIYYPRINAEWDAWEAAR